MLKTGVRTPKMIECGQLHSGPGAAVTAPGQAPKELALEHPQFTLLRSADITERDRERFWSVVDQSAGINGCWRRCRSHGHSGYARFSAGGQHIYGHRFAFLAVLGDPPPHLPHVLHKCPGGSNAWCVNPAHLAPGTMLENHADRDREGRTARGDRNGTRTHPESRPDTRGERNAQAKLTAAAVLAIHLDLQRGVTSRALARRFGVSTPTIIDIKWGRTWSEIGAAFQYRPLRQPRVMIQCACGCGAAFETPDRSGRPRRFVSGHNGRGVKRG
jgi:hypothetical protein